MKKILLILCVISLFGCATAPDMRTLEEKAFDMQRGMMLLGIGSQMMYRGQAPMYYRPQVHTQCVQQGIYTNCNTY